MTKSGASTEDMSGPEQAPASRRGRPALLAVFPESRALPVPPAGEIVGRDWLARFGVVDPKVSREHISFARRGGLRVMDHGARNGTWLNGTKLAKDEPVPLADGDVLRAGRTIMVYREEYGGPDNPAPPLGALVSPFGLWRVRAELQALIARKPTTVLIEGETGTGKELIASEIAARLGRSNPYVAVNIAGIPAGVFDSQFFGYVRGAFSGAAAAAKGIFLANDHGTVFLDEIGELPIEMQAKLLRVLDNHEIVQVGADHAMKVDVLVLAATHRPLDAMVEDGSFRRDLLARLSPVRIELPPLRERAEDVFDVARSAAPADALIGLEPEAVERLLLHDWPANVRELHALVGKLGASTFKAWALAKVLPPIRPTRTALTREAAEAAVSQAGGNQSRAAKALGVSRGQLIRQLKQR